MIIVVGVVQKARCEEIVEGDRSPWNTRNLNKVFIISKWILIMLIVKISIIVVVEFLSLSFHEFFLHQFYTHSI
ncbi:hypothetical protein TRFO_33200 [Tritrichomonas foetus]|uniref:Uncharacterized protein n=1 Tax=Tritrichomonas foetus TaxID=1144522 RepID=A0A1J4JM48_9EUKA|nr:hypothetical protein TRFO_33200 [Tritrichomonas foetus]|eukprot:OHT00175.1 hypothetical protein TRFO_33200 [Tritrichomonas foetus]